MRYKTVQEIRQLFESQKTKLLMETFDLSAKAKAVDVSMSATTKEKLGPKGFDAVRLAEGEAWAESERQRLKSEYVALELEQLAAIQARVEEIEAELAPKNASADDLLTASQATPQQLIDMMDLALGAGFEDAALLAFAAGRQRQLEEVVAHALSVGREDWEELYAELSLAANLPWLEDAGEIEAAFDTFSQKAPSQAEIARARPQSDINIYGQLGHGG
jgi:hypothetical protein